MQILHSPRRTNLGNSGSRKEVTTSITFFKNPMRYILFQRSYARAQAYVKENLWKDVSTNADGFKL